MHSSSPTIKSRDGLGDNILTRTIYAEIRHWFYLCIISNEWNVMAVASSASQGPLGCTLVNDRNVPSCVAFPSGHHSAALLKCKQGYDWCNMHAPPLEIEAKKWLYIPSQREFGLRVSVTV